MNDRDTMGDVYEYVLGKMAAAGTNGQFRTPRHIIRMMVELMQPKIDDRICDPAMGTAGFLVESAKYVKTNHSQELLKKQNQTHFRTGMFSGFDTDLSLRFADTSRSWGSATAPSIWRRFREEK